MAAYVSSSVSVYPSTSTVTFTTSYTLTSTITATGTPYPPPRDNAGPIEGLDECSQTIVVESLANSKYNPADFPCIYAELKNLGISGKVGAKCSNTVLDQYNRFQDDVCRGVFPPTTPSSIIIITPSVTPTPAPIYKVTTPIVNVTVVPVPVTSVVVVPGHPTVPSVPTMPVPQPPEYTGGAATMKMGALAGVVGFVGLIFAVL